MMKELEGEMGGEMMDRMMKELDGELDGEMMDRIMKELDGEFGGEMKEKKKGGQKEKKGKPTKFLQLN